VVGTALAGAIPDQPRGHPVTPLLTHASILDCPAGALRTPSRAAQPLPGLELLTLPPVASTVPGVGVGEGVGAADGGRGV
jgi:hypothetical protein